MGSPVSRSLALLLLALGLLTFAGARPCPLSFRQSPLLLCATELLFCSLLRFVLLLRKLLMVLLVAVHATAIGSAFLPFPLFVEEVLSRKTGFASNAFLDWG